MTDRPREWTPRQEPSEGVFKADGFEIRVSRVGPNPAMEQFYDDYDVVIRDPAGTEFALRVWIDRELAEHGSGLIGAAHSGMTELLIAITMPDMFRDNWRRVSRDYPRDEGLAIRQESLRLLEVAKKFNADQVDRASGEFFRQYSRRPEKLIPPMEKKLREKTRTMLTEALKAIKAKKKSPPEGPTISGDPFMGGSRETGKLTKRLVEKHLGPCLNEAIESCGRNPLLIFSGCPETTQLAARTAAALDLEFVVMQGKARTWDHQVVDHVWVELPELDLRIETNASQIMGLPTYVIVLDLDYRSDRYSKAFENMEFLERVTEKGEKFYARLANDVADCVRARKG